MKRKYKYGVLTEMIINRTYKTYYVDYKHLWAHKKDSKIIDSDSSYLAPFYFVVNNGVTVQDNGKTVIDIK